MTETSTPTVVASVWVMLYQHTKLTRHHSHSHAVKEPIMAQLLLWFTQSTPVTTPINFSTDNETPKKSLVLIGFILSGLVLVAALGYYFWTKRLLLKQLSFAPMGGLSPVGGSTQCGTKSVPKPKKQSIWTKKYSDRFKSVNSCSLAIYRFKLCPLLSSLNSAIV